MKITKFCCFLIPETTNKYYFFILFLVGAFFRKFIPEIIPRSGKSSDSDKTEEYFYILSNIVSDLLTGIFHCILKRKEKNDNKTNNENNILINSFIYKRQIKKTKFFNKFIFLISIIDFICQLCFYFGCYENEKIDKKFMFYLFLVVDVVSRHIFSRLILKTYFYFHHYISFLLNVIILLVLLFAELFFDKKKENTGTDNFILLLLSLIQYLLYSLEDILNKVALTNLFIIPQTLLFWKGVYSLIYFFPFTLLIFIFDKNITIDNLYTYFNINSVLSFACFVFFNIMRSIYLVNVIDHFSSQHISILKVLETIIIYVYYFIDRILIPKNNKLLSEFDLIEIIACLLLLYSSLIHNESIIIDCKKMKKKTKYFLEIESLEEKNKRIIN